jgi:hypothetical protein
VIIPASQRGNAKQLANHLSDLTINDHVELYEARGLFHDQSIQEALREMHAASKGSRCQKHLFSLSVDPVQGLDHDGKLYEEIFHGLDERFPMLKDQPRLIVFHEKEGRRHAHVIYSRINREGKAIELGLYKKKLTSFSYDLFEKHAPEQMPKNLQSWAKRQHEERLKQDHTRAELERERRTKQSREAHHQILQEAVKQHDTLKSLDAHLQEKGYRLCNGKRALLAYDMHTQETYAITRATGLKMNELKQRYVGHADLPSMDKVKSELVKRGDHAIKTPEPPKELARTQDTLEKRLQERDQKMAAQREQYRQEREKLDQKQRVEQTKAEFTLRSKNTGDEAYRKQKQEMEDRHYAEKHALIQANLKQRRALDKEYRVASVKEQNAKLYAFSRGLKEWKDRSGKSQTLAEYQRLHSLTQGLKVRDNATLKQDREGVWKQQQAERQVLKVTQTKELDRFWQNVREQNKAQHQRRDREIQQADQNIVQEEAQYKQRIALRKPLNVKSDKDAPQIKKVFKVRHDRGYVQASHETQVKSSQSSVDTQHKALKTAQHHERQQVIQTQSEARAMQREQQSTHRRDRTVIQREGMIDKGEHVNRFQASAKPPEHIPPLPYVGNTQKPPEKPLKGVVDPPTHPKHKPSR